MRKRAEVVDADLKNPNGGTFAQLRDGYEHLRSKAGQRLFAGSLRGRSPALAISAFLCFADSIPRMLRSAHHWGFGRGTVSLEPLEVWDVDLDAQLRFRQARPSHQRLEQVGLNTSGRRPTLVPT